MNRDFIKTLQPDYSRIFNKLYTEVLELNTMLGLCDEGVNKDQLIETYKKLLIEEQKEVSEAVKKEDKCNLVKELIDVLVIGGFLSYLFTETKYELSPNMPMYQLKKEFREFCDYSYNHASSASADCAMSCLMSMNCDVEKAVDEVLRSNRSKFPTEQELREALGLESTTLGVVLKAQCDILETGGRYSGVHYKKLVDNNGEVRYSFWSTHEYGKEKYKYLKAVTYSDADMSEVW